MSTRRINFLARQKILGKDIKVQLVVSGTTKRFTAAAQLADYNFPPAARIFMDVTQSSMESIRFDFGTVASPLFREEDISRLTGDSVVFNLYVIDSANARKLGVAEAIRIKSDSAEIGGVNSLLPVDGSRDLGGNLWKVEFDAPGAEGASDAPVLCVDREASRGSASDFLGNSQNSALILPAAMRVILSHVLLHDEGFAYDPTSVGWRHSWVRFASHQSGDPLPEEERKDQIPAWIEQACAAFARRSDLRGRFLKQIEQ
jgi:hypothetical protein